VNETPRDLVGYGADPPDPRWPDGKRVALNLVLNYEEGGENTPLDGDPASEAYLHEVVGAPATVGRRNLNTESMFEFGSRAGFWRVHRLVTSHGLPLTVFGVGQALERNPDAARAMVDAGWEVASHGWRWIDYGEFSPEEERAHLERSVAAIERVCGRRPVGWYTGRGSDATRRLVVEHGGFLYDSDSYADELPYWLDVDGTDHLVVPYTLDANDFKFLLPNGFVTADDFATYLIDSLDELRADGGRLMSVGLHCRIVGRPGRIVGLRRFLEHVAACDDVWVATRADIARHWRAEHPAQGSANGGA
jgi:allantoinase